MSKKNNHSFLMIIIVLFLIIADQASKTFLISFLKTQAGMSMKVTSFFSLVYAWNHGISFGFFSGYYQYSNYIFLVVNSVVIFYLIYLLRSSTKKLEKSGIAVIVGGAIGNIVDRIYRGAVFDFLYFHYDIYGFPAFNLADSFINIGVMMVIISYTNRHL
ncbi:MAG: signal peptidase II [Rickettsiaceae bacterium]|nr:signal peptidase II [Rickettsiaceae bacterium]